MYIYTCLYKNKQHMLCTYIRIYKCKKTINMGICATRVKLKITYNNKMIIWYVSIMLNKIFYENIMYYICL